MQKASKSESVGKIRFKSLRSSGREMGSFAMAGSISEPLEGTDGRCLGTDAGDMCGIAGLGIACGSHASGSVKTKNTSLQAACARLRSWLCVVGDKRSGGGTRGRARWA